MLAVEACSSAVREGAFIFYTVLENETLLAFIFYTVLEHETLLAFIFYTVLENETH